MTSQTSSTSKLTKADFTSDQEVRWCPGCGDYAILATIQRLMPQLGIAKENMVFITGIGCSGRLSYYMNTYGFHTIHGRAPAVATGLKITRPELSVWIITGDGDGLSIGGNHLMHLLRRNLDVNVLLFNNRIYGLTKGQSSPTSERGKLTKSSPYGSLEQAINPLTFALAAEASFIARGLDVDTKGLAQILTAAVEHKGTSFVEIFQNCNVYNDKTFAEFTESSVRAQRTLWLEENKPYVFGATKDKAINFTNTEAEIVTVNEANLAALPQHNLTSANTHIAHILARMSYPDFPVPMGILRRVQKATYDELLTERHQLALKQQGQANLAQLFQQANIWHVPKI